MKMGACSVGGRSIAIALLAVAIAAVSACKSKPPPATLDDVRPLMKALLQAEREHRNSHGNFWRDRQEPVDPETVVRVLGTDLRKAPGFEFSMSPPGPGMDPTLTITARGTGANAGQFLRCTYDSTQQDKEPACEESGAKE